jgi:hypothetical protein
MQNKAPIVKTKTYALGFETGRSVRAELFNEVGIVALTMLDENYRTEFVTEISVDDVTNLTELFKTVGEEIAATKNEGKK